MRLKRVSEAPPGGFAVIYKKSGHPDFKAHGWSLNSVGAQLYQEKLRRGEKTTLEHCKLDVEAYTCNELLKLPQRENFVEITSEWRAEDYMPMDSYDRELSSPSSKGSLFTVVFPFCAKDGMAATKLMKWIVEITPPNDHPLILSHDYQTPPSFIENIATLAKLVFKSIKVLSYSPPCVEHWPPTIAFIAAAKYMEKVGNSWLWMEPDCVPLVPHWLEALQEAYWKCGKAFAGPVVQDMGHLNGTAIYPANTPKRIPRALELKRTAWDITMKAEMIFDCHDLQPMYQHAWSVDNGRLHQYAGGAVPSFPKGSPLLNQIHKEAVIFHRCKDLTLIDRLQERRLQPA